MFKRLLAVLALSTALVSASLQPAQAAPAVAAVGAFFATPLGGIVGNFALSLVASSVGKLIQQFTSPKSPSSAAVAGVRGSVASGGDVPLSFIMGYRMTAGSFAYRGSWGQAGKTPNAFYVEERILSDLPMPNRPAVWIGDKKVTVDWAAAPTAQGYPIVEGRVDGKDHWWVIYHDGTQTVPDGYMLSKFGSHPDHPYTGDMIGRGQAKVIMTFKLNPDLIKASYPKLKFETDGIRLYDISKDSTAGGSGAHRIDNSATWEPSNLLPVHIFNALIGIRYAGQWVWGGQNIEVGRLPASTWIAAIAEARALVDLADGSTEQQYRGGFEITGNMEPQAFIKEALKGCAGRFAEIGGTYKMICGVPSSAAFSFTDNDIIVSREQGYDPYPLLEQTHNAIRATYPEPAVGWATKDAPARYSAELEAEDMGRQLAIDVGYEMVFSGSQVQRLMKAAIEEARRFRVHPLTLPPEASELEPLDTVSWTSAANSYTAKKFILTEVEDEPTTLTPVQLQEIDPSDYDFDADVDELPWSVGELATTRPAPQEVSDWGVAPYTHFDATGTARRPGVKMFWDGDQPDVRAMLYQVRLADTEDVVLSGEFASTFIDGQGVTPAGAMLSDQDYELRGRYDPLSNRQTDWTEWTPVHTPDLPDVELPPITPNMLGEELANQSAVLMGNQSGSIADQLARLRQLQELLAGALMDVSATAKERLDVLDVTTGGANAAVIRNEKAIVAEGEARALAIQEVVANVNNVIAGGYLRLEATVIEEGASALITAKVRASFLTTFSIAAWVIKATADNAGGTTSEFGVYAHNFRMFSPTGEVGVSVFDVDEDGIATMVAAKVGTITAGLLKDPADTYRFDIANGRLYRVDGKVDLDLKLGRLIFRKAV